MNIKTGFQTIKWEDKLIHIYKQSSTEQIDIKFAGGKQVLSNINQIHNNGCSISLNTYNSNVNSDLYGKIYGVAANRTQIRYNSSDRYIIVNQKTNNISISNLPINIGETYIAFTPIQILLHNGVEYNEEPLQEFNNLYTFVGKHNLFVQFIDNNLGLILTDNMSLKDCVTFAKEHDIIHMSLLNNTHSSMVVNNSTILSQGLIPTTLNIGLPQNVIYSPLNIIHKTINKTLREEKINLPVENNIKIVPALNTKFTGYKLTTAIPTQINIDTTEIELLYEPNFKRQYTVEYYLNNALIDNQIVYTEDENIYHDNISEAELYNIIEPYIKEFDGYIYNNIISAATIDTTRTIKLNYIQDTTSYDVYYTVRYNFIENKDPEEEVFYTTVHKLTDKINFTPTLTSILNKFGENYVIVYPIELPQTVQPFETINIQLFYDKEKDYQLYTVIFQHKTLKENNPAFIPQETTRYFKLKKTINSHTINIPIRTDFTAQEIELGALDYQLSNDTGTTILPTNETTILLSNANNYTIIVPVWYSKVPNKNGLYHYAYKLANDFVAQYVVSFNAIFNYNPIEDKYLGADTNVPTQDPTNFKPNGYTIIQLSSPQNGITGVELGATYTSICTKNNVTAAPLLPTLEPTLINNNTNAFGNTEFNSTDYCLNLIRNHTLQSFGIFTDVIGNYFVYDTPYWQFLDGTSATVNEFDMTNSTVKSITIYANNTTHNIKMKQHIPNTDFMLTKFSGNDNLNKAMFRIRLTVDFISHSDMKVTLNVNNVPKTNTFRLIKPAATNINEEYGEYQFTFDASKFYKFNTNIQPIIEITLDNVNKIVIHSVELLLGDINKPVYNYQNNVLDILHSSTFRKYFKPTYIVENGQYTSVSDTNCLIFEKE